MSQYNAEKIREKLTDLRKFSEILSRTNPDSFWDWGFSKYSKMEQDNGDNPLLDCHRVYCDLIAFLQEEDVQWFAKHLTEYYQDMVLERERREILDEVMEESEQG